MKRAKIMLTSIAVLALVGGALAFKANTKFNSNYCLGTASLGSCPTLITNSRPLAGGTATSYFVKITGTDCSQATCGEISTTFEHD